MLPSSSSQPRILQELAHQLQKELRSKEGRVRLPSTKAHQLALDLLLVEEGIRAACLIDAFSPTSANIRALQRSLQHASYSSSKLGQRCRLIQHAPSEQLYYLNLTLLPELRSSLGSHPQGSAQAGYAPWMRWLDARSCVPAGTRLTRPPAYLIDSLDVLSHMTRRSDQGEVLSLGHRLSPTHNMQDEENQAQLQGVALSGLLLEYGVVYSLLVDEEEVTSGPQTGDGDNDDDDDDDQQQQQQASEVGQQNNNLGGESLTLISLCLVPLPLCPAAERETVARSVLSFSFPTRALLHSEKEELIQSIRLRTMQRIRKARDKGRPEEQDGEGDADEGNAKQWEFRQWLARCSVEVETKEVVLNSVGL